MLPKRPMSLKLAYALALLGIGVGLVSTILEKDLYGDGWVLILPARIFFAIIWLTMLTLALNGRRWVRYVFGALVLLGLLRIGYYYPDHLIKEGLWLLYLPSTVAAALFFSPAANAWYRNVRELYAQQNAQADAG